RTSTCLWWRARPSVLGFRERPQRNSVLTPPPRRHEGLLQRLYIVERGILPAAKHRIGPHGGGHLADPVGDHVFRLESQDTADLGKTHAVVARVRHIVAALDGDVA